MENSNEPDLTADHQIWIYTGFKTRYLSSAGAGLKWRNEKYFLLEWLPFLSAFVYLQTQNHRADKRLTKTFYSLSL